MTEENPYQTPAADIGSGEVAVEGPEVASPWIRLLAIVVDTLIFIPFIIPLQFSMGIYDGFPDKIVPPDFITTVTLLAAGILIYVIINGYTLNKNGQTLGKLICKIKIVRTDLSKATFARILFIRYLPMTFISQIPFGGMILSGFVDPLLIFRKSRKCLHDNIADTIVIKA